MKATLWGGGTIELTELQGGERLYVGSDNCLYRDLMDDNPHPYSDGGGTFFFHEPIDEVRLDEITFERLEWDEEGQEIKSGGMMGCDIYEGSINGNLEVESHSPELVVVKLLAKLFPHGKKVYRKDGTPFTILQWGARDLMLYGFWCCTEEPNRTSRAAPTHAWQPDIYELRDDEIGWYQTALEHGLWNSHLRFEDGTTEMEYARELDLD